MAELKCAHCGSLLNDRYIPIKGKKYCTVTCALEATGFKSDPGRNSWVLDARHAHLSPRR